MFGNESLGGEYSGVFASTVIHSAPVLVGLSTLFDVALSNNRVHEKGRTQLHWGYLSKDRQ